ncbi:MAG: alpha-galactosidase [Spirochaetota bacterium]
MLELRLETIQIGHSLKGMQSKVLLNRESGTVSNEGWELSFSVSSGRIDLRIHFNRNTFLKNITLNTVILSDIDAADLAFFKNGYQSWSYSGTLFEADRQRKPRFSFVIANQENVNNPPTGKKGHVTSDMFCFIGNKANGRGIFIGQLPPFSQLVEYSFMFSHRQHIMDITWDFNCNVKAGEWISLDPVFFREGEIHNELDEYTKMAADARSVPRTPDLRRGWCSWYYYYTDITIEEIQQNLRFSREKSIPFQFFQIDDGYQAGIGDWLDLKNGFNGSMKMLADSIRDSGYVPGLWVAPFIASKKSRLIQEYPRWVMRDRSGKPVVAGYNPNWDGTYYALDITSPGYLQWLEKVFTTIRYEWGFEYIKLDFMYAASLPGMLHDSSMSRAGALELGLSKIREFSGDDAFLLGCGMPISGAVGYMNAMRVSCDVSQGWRPSFIERLAGGDSHVETRGAIRNSLVRAFMHGKFWINDPDCLMLRRQHTGLTPHQRDSLYNAIMIMGGMMVISDRMTDYTPGEMDDLFRAFDIFEKTSQSEAVVLDLLEKNMPEFVYNRSGHLAVFNFSDKTKEQVLFHPGIESQEGAGANVEDMNTGEQLNISGSTVFTLPPHGSRIFRFKK